MSVTRRALLQSAGSVAALAALAGCRGAGALAPAAKEVSMPETPAVQPVVFVGHGSPMNAVQDTTWSRAFRGFAGQLPRPRAVLAISAHWFVDGTFTTGNEHPETIHDFGGFPPELYAITYPAPGDAALARRVVDVLGSAVASVRLDWGLDHGTWTVLRHLLPAADVPVVQLSLDARLPPSDHLALGKALAPLRREGVLILGSGNLVHNLSDAIGRLQRGNTSTPDWARAFDDDAAKALASRDHAWLTAAPTSPGGRQAHPTPDHYLPVLYVAGAAEAADPVSFPIQGFDLGSLSMRAVRFG